MLAAFPGWDSVWKLLGQTKGHEMAILLWAEPVLGSKERARDLPGGGGSQAGLQTRTREHVGAGSQGTGKSKDWGAEQR